MKTIIGNTLLIKAAFILLLHAFVPHQHEQRISSQEHLALHNSADDFFDMLSLAFHESHDEGNLDYFDSVSEAAPVAKDLIFYPLLISMNISAEYVSIQQPVPTDWIVLPKHQTICLPQLANRPPPVII